MSRSSEFRANGIKDLIAALPRISSGLSRLYLELERWRHEVDVASLTGDERTQRRSMREADEAFERILSAEGGLEFLGEMERLRRSSVETLEGATLSESAFDAPPNFSPDGLGRDDPRAVLAPVLVSLNRSAEMMKEIVNETRRDRAEFRLRSRQIDRTLARTDEILANLIGSSH